MSNARQYNDPYCWQYTVRLQREQEKQDMSLLLNEAVVSNLHVSDFTFTYVEKENKTLRTEVKKFIETYEWLGTMPHLTTHRFIVTYQGIIGGAVVMATPNAFMYLLGERSYEKMIARGACAWWTPKNLGSFLIMQSIRWMAQNTKRRVFTAYSDVEAKELGTIYQACNFIYLGKTYGASKVYFDENHPEKGWFSDRNFRTRSAYKRFAKELNITWQPEWQNGDKIYWEKIPEEITKQLKDTSKAKQGRCLVKKAPTKHKYCYILGRDKKETKRLRKLFIEKHPELVNIPYPTVRGA